MIDNTESSPRRPTNGVFVPNEVIYLEIQDLKMAVLKGMAQRPTWAALGKILAVLVPVIGLVLAAVAL